MVDEVPAEVRTQHDLLAELSELHRLQLAHFQSHYLPDGWQRRVRTFGTFGDLQVDLVDPYDIFVGKLFSVRKKDKADLNALVGTLDSERVRNRLQDSTRSLRTEARLLEAAKENWYVLFGEDLPA